MITRLINRHSIVVARSILLNALLGFGFLFLSLHPSYAASKKASAIPAQNENSPLMQGQISSCPRQVNLPIESWQLDPGSGVAKAARDSSPEPDKWINNTSANCLKHPKYKLNFGPVVYNDYYKLYRSTGLNADGLRVYGNHLTDNGLELPKRIMYLHQNNYEESLNWKGTLKSWGFRIYGKLYGGNFAHQEWNVSQNLNEKSCPSLTTSHKCDRDPYKGLFPFKYIHPKGNKDDGSQVDYVEAKCNPLVTSGENRCNTCSDSRDPTCKPLSKLKPDDAKKNLSNLMKQLLVADGPTGFHCQGGLHRTGAAALLLRYLQGDPWTTRLQEPKTVKTSMKVNINGKESEVETENTLTNLAMQEYYDHNSKDFRMANIEMIQTFSQDRFFKCVQQRFAPYLNAKPTNPPDSIKNCYPFQKDTVSGLIPPDQFNIVEKERLFKECE